MKIITERGLFYKIVFKVHTEYFDACLQARQFAAVSEVLPFEKGKSCL
jgi:hypothetical protein